MFKTIRTILATRSERADARVAYFAADHSAGRLLAELARTGDADIRAQLLRHLSDREKTMADAYFAAFGPDLIRDEQRDMVDSMRLSALLLRLLADVESAVAYRRTRRLTDTVLESVAGDVLDIMARRPHAGHRVALARTGLYAAVVDVVGGHAAETLTALRAPDAN